MHKDVTADIMDSVGSGYIRRTYLNNGVSNGAFEGEGSSSDRNNLQWGELVSLVRKIPLPQYEQWRRAIEKDDDKTVRDILSTSKEPASFLIFGHFNQAGDHRYHFRMPIVQAACFASRKVLRLFLSYKFQLNSLEPGNNNILHCLCIAVHAHGYSKRTVRAFSEVYLILSECLPKETKKLLFMQENDEDFRPIELAVHLQVLFLFDFFVHEEGIYCYTRLTKGLRREVYYDLTDYESWGKGSRRDRSPIKQLLNLENRNTKAEAVKVLESPLVTNWMSVVLYRNLPGIILWGMLRLFFFLMFYVADLRFLIPRSQNVPDYSRDNITVKCAISSPPPDSTAVLAIVAILTTVMLLFDIAEFAVYLLQHYKGRLLSWGRLTLGIDFVKNLLTHNTFYRMNHFFLLIGLSIRLLSMTGIETVKGMWSYLYVVVNFCNVWSLLYFIELLPGIGHYVSGMQRMVSVMANFSVLFVFLYLSFTYMFFITFLAQGVCTSEFGTIERSLYSGFLVMLNIVEMHEVLDKYPQLDRSRIAFLHIVYVFLVGIVLMNFLIALQASATDRNAGIVRISRTLQVLSAGILVEQRTSWFTKRLIKILERKKLVHSSDNRIFLPCVITIPINDSSQTFPPNLPGTSDTDSTDSDACVNIAAVSSSYQI